MIAAHLTAAFAVAPASRALTGRTSAPRAARPTRGMTVHAKGKGARYRNELSDPYQGAKKSAEKRAKSAPKQNPADGPLNAAFAADEKTEEYFLFVRKMKTDGSNADEDDSTAPSIRADDAGVGAALGLKPDADAPVVASLGKWLPLGDVSIAAGGDLDVVVAERRDVLTGFAKRKHLKLLPVGADETLEFGVRVQRGPPRGSDPTAVFPVATSEEHLAIAWDHEKLGNEGTHRAELRLMQAMAPLGKGTKNEMLASAMDVVKAQQEAAARKKEEESRGE